MSEVIEAVPQINPEAAAPLREYYLKVLNTLACEPQQPTDIFADRVPNPFDLDGRSKNETSPHIKELKKKCRSCPAKLGCALLIFESLGSSGTPSDIFRAGMTPHRQKATRNLARRAVDKKWGNRARDAAYERAVAHTAFLYVAKQMSEPANQNQQ